MADKTNIDPTNPELPPEAIAFASRMYDAARAGQIDIFQQALPAGLPINMMNDKGDSLVGPSFLCLTSTTHLDFPESPQVSFAQFISRDENPLSCFSDSPLYSVVEGHQTDLHQLMLAAYHGHAPLVKLLIQYGADPNKVNDRGQTPLAGAVFKGESDVIEVSALPCLSCFKSAEPIPITM